MPLIDDATSMVSSWSVVAVLGALVSGCGSTLAPVPFDQHRPFPQVGTLDGSLLVPVRIVTIVPQNLTSDMASAFVGFGGAVGGSQWWKSVGAEYGLGGVSSVQLTGPGITMNMTDHDLFEYIDHLVNGASGSNFPPDGHTVYLLYLPPDVAVVRDGVANTNCNDFGGYHAPFGARGDNLAIIQSCSDPYSTGDMTAAASHEIFESATDPDGNGYRLPVIAFEAPWNETIWNAWDLTGGAELADLCVGSYWHEGDRVYQRVWSNVRARAGGDPCLPILDEPYYNADVPQDWYPVGSAGTATIPVTGWAVGSIDAWPVAAFVQSATTGFDARIASSANGTLSPGRTIDLTVTAPANTPSGTFALIDIASDRPTAAKGGAPLTDGGHNTYVGIYVP